MTTDLRACKCCKVCPCTCDLWKAQHPKSHVVPAAAPAHTHTCHIGCAKIVLSSTSFLWTTFLYFSQFWSFLSSGGYQCQTPLSVPTVWGILLSLPVLVALSCPSLSSLEFLPSFFFCVVYLTSYSSYDLWLLKEHQNQGERTHEGSFSPGVAA